MPRHAEKQAAVEDHKLVPKVSLRLSSATSDDLVCLTNSVRSCLCERCLSGIRDSLGVLLKAHYDGLDTDRALDFVVTFESYTGDVPTSLQWELFPFRFLNTRDRVIESDYA